MSKPVASEANKVQRDPCPAGATGSICADGKDGRPGTAYYFVIRHRNHPAYTWGHTGGPWGRRQFVRNPGQEARFNPEEYDPAICGTGIVDGEWELCSMEVPADVMADPDRLKDFLEAHAACLRAGLPQSVQQRLLVAQEAPKARPEGDWCSRCALGAPCGKHPKLARRSQGSRA